MKRILWILCFILIPSIGNSAQLKNTIIDGTLTLNGTKIITSDGAVNITPLAGSSIILDGAVNIDAGVITGATSITSTSFVGDLTGNADTVTTNANLTGPITSTGNATTIASQTGTGSTFAVATSPTFVTDITAPLVIGGTGTTSTLTYKTTTGVGATGARHIFQVGNDGSTEAMTILNNGNVGFGNSSPSRFEIAGSNSNVAVEISTWAIDNTDKSILTFQKSSSSTINALAVTATGEGLGTILFRGVNTNSGSDIAASIRIQGGGSPDNDAVPGRMAFWTSDNVLDQERMCIADSGNVGIGTTDPDQLLHIEASTAATNTIESVLELSQITSDTPAPGLGVAIDFNLETTPGNEEIGVRLAAQIKDPGAGTEEIEFVVSTMTGGVLSQKMVVTGDGKVGIGVDDPDTNLHVLTDSNPAVTNERSTSGIVGIELRNVTDSFFFGMNAAEKFSIAATANLDDSPFFIVEQAGNVGINVTDPDTKLEVLGSTGIKISFDGSNFATLVSSSGGDLAITPSGGNVGVNIAPTHNLTIGNGSTSAGFIAINEDTDDGTNNVTFTVPALATDVDYVLPADDGNAGEFLQTDGSGVLDWVAAGGDSLSSLWVNGGTVTTTIGTQSLFTKVTHFVNTGREDPNGNAIGDPTDDDITLGANAAGDYMLHLQASHKANSATNKVIIIIPKIILATAKTITGATNATPIVVTVNAAHNLQTGDYVTQTSVGGNTAANGDFYVTVLSPTTYSLQDLLIADITGNGAYTSGGTVDAVYPGNVAIRSTVDSTKFEVAAKSGTIALAVNDVVEVAAANNSDTINIDFNQIQYGLERIQ